MSHFLSITRPNSIGVNAENALPAQAAGSVERPGSGNSRTSRLRQLGRQAARCQRKH